MLQKILLAFIPIFIAVDAIGVLPLFISFTQELTRQERKKIILQSMVTALCLAFGFIILSKFVFRFLGITIGDFMIAGGAVLFAIAIVDMISATKKRRLPPPDLGAVPLGTPLIVGPAVLTTCLIVIGEYGFYPALISVTVNVLLAGLIFFSSDALMKVIGKSGSKALSKVTSLLLAAIAVKMIRKGLLTFFS